MTPDGVSILTATRGRRELLLEKVRALAAQSLPPERFEWIVAFDGPDPDGERALREATPSPIRLRTVSTPGLGPGPARDAAASLARYEVLYLSDDDCLPDPPTLERHLTAQARPAVYLGEVIFEDGGSDAPDARRGRPPRRPGWWNLGGANASLPRPAFEAVGGFGDALVGYGGEDLWLGWRLKRHGLEVRGLADAAALHRGADPERAAGSERAHAAGANAVRIATMEPALAWRLGVHPTLLAVKRGLLAGPLGRTLWRDAARRDYERAYAAGARDAWREGAATVPTKTPRSGKDSS